MFGLPFPPLLRQTIISSQPIDHLTEDFPEVVAYLRTLESEATVVPSAATLSSQPSHYAEDRASEQLTDSLMANAADIMQRAEAEGQDPEEQLRQLVSNAVLQGVVTGYRMGDASTSSGDSFDTESKRRRTEGT
jgi:hypothetical protein